MSRVPTDPEYAIRAYRPDDRAGVVSLRERFFGGWSEPEFVWKAESPPESSRGLTLVAEHDGVVIGVVGSLSLPVRRGNRSTTAVQHVDAVVHPDYRRRGVYTRLNEGLYDHYVAREPRVSHGFTNARVVSALDGADGDRSVDPFCEYYRVQRPGELRPRFPSPVLTPFVRAGTSVSRALRRLHTPTSLATDGRTVRRRSDVPTALLADLYRDAVPETAHFERDPALYRWRFSHPKWEYVTYVASVAGSPEAALVAGTRTVRPGLDVTRITEVLPLSIDGRGAAVAALLGRLLEDHAESAVVVATGHCVPAPTLEAFGFVSPDSRFVSHLFASPLFDRSYFVRRPLGSDERVDGPWLLTYFAREIG